jgi:hypothetical protein
MATSALFVQFTPVILMMSVITINHLINNQRAERKTSAEASRLRSALAAELRSVLELYNKNLELIERKADHILSTRSSVVVYKGNLGRLTALLDDSVIEHVVRVFAQNERIEATIAAHSNFKCGLTYQFSVLEAKFDEWRKLFEQASADVSYVSRMLSGSSNIPLPTEASIPWPKGFRLPAAPNRATRAVMLQSPARS